MTSIRTLLNSTLFDEMVNGGYVRIQTHPTLPLSIANYSEKTQYENAWNEVTLACRGLIYDADGGVVARPYRKFFNYGDTTNTGTLDLTAPAVVTDKLDGSLGISYPTPDGLAVATRGSFASDQAVHATQLLRTRYRHFDARPGTTYLWEIVYPLNRIVVDYGDRDDLILHGAVATATGHVYTAAECYEWPGPRVTQFQYETLAEALAAEPRPNAEGLVVMLGTDQTMVKIKQDDYVALHRIITGLNARTVWEWLGDGKTVGDLCATLPDDFHGWVEDLAAELMFEAADLITAATNAHEATLRSMPAGWTRGDYARAIAANPSKPYMFLLLDGNHSKARDLAWRAVKPSGARSLINHSEAVA